MPDQRSTRFDVVAHALHGERRVAPLQGVENAEVLRVVPLTGGDNGEDEALLRREQLPQHITRAGGLLVIGLFLALLSVLTYYCGPGD